MYNNISEFLEDWANETGKTLEVYAMIPENLKAIFLDEKVRTLERLAFHIPQIITQIGAQTGLFDTPELPEDPLPATMDDIKKLYMDVHERMGVAVQKDWKNGSLTEEVALYRKNWRRGDVLSLLTHHEVHHRSQMTVIMRLTGLKVPELYGPVREDWEKWGLPIAK